MGSIVQNSYTVIVANGEACSLQLTTKVLSEAAFVIVLDGAMHRFLELNVHANVLLGDFDRNDHAFEELKERFPALEIIHTPDQEATDFEKGIHYAEQLGYEAIIVLWATGKRADHSFTNMANLIRFIPSLSIQLVDDYSVIYRIPKVFEKHFEKGSIVSLVPIGKVEGITTENLKYPLTNETLELGIRNGNSNEAAASGLVKISYQTGEMLLMECHD